MSYLYFIGIDIAKDSFEVAFHSSKINSKIKTKTQKFSNDNNGFEQFMTVMNHEENLYFITLEATGGYEMNLLLFLCSRGLAVHRLETLKSSHYLRSLRCFAKNDVVDAEALARFGAERHETLPIFVPSSQEIAQMQKFRMRRDDLITMRMAEKQRLKHPNYADIKQDLLNHIAYLTQRIDEIDAKIAELIDNNAILKQKKAIMCAFKGIGQQTSHILLTICPELGSLTRRQIASLAGVAPHPRESGTYQGYRSTKGGRHELKKALFMVALSGKRYNPVLKQFFDGLVARGKKKMVALTATMRKIIVIINAKVRDFLQSNPLIDTPTML